MLGRASWMRLPEIVGVELSGKPQPGITATDLVLSLTEFLRWQKVVGAYLEFRGEAPPPSPSAIGPPSPTWRRNMVLPRPCSSSTSRPLDYLKLTGRDDEQVRLKPCQGGRSLPMPGGRQYERACTFDLSSVVPLAGPSNPIAACRYRLASAESGGPGQGSCPEAGRPRLMAPSSSPPSPVAPTPATRARDCRAGLLARNANRLGLMRKPQGQILLAPAPRRSRFT